MRREIRYYDCLGSGLLTKFANRLRGATEYGQAVFDRFDSYHEVIIFTAFLYAFLPTNYEKSDLSKTERRDSLVFI